MLHTVWSIKITSLKKQHYGYKEQISGYKALAIVADGKGEM